MYVCILSNVKYNSDRLTAEEKGEGGKDSTNEHK